MLSAERNLILENHATFQTKYGNVFEVNLRNLF